MIRTAALLLAAVVGTATAADILVSSASDISNALGSIQPGDTLVMTDGIWTNQVIRFDAEGTAAEPITLRAQTPGGVLLNGTSRLEIGGSHLVVDGLRFEGGALTGGHVIRFQEGSKVARNCVLRNTAIIDYNPPSIDTRYFWVSLYGTDNVIENCRFENQNHSGVTVVVWGDWPNRHTIRNNHFVDRPRGNANGWETIRIGTSGVTQFSSQTLVESNLFERTDGEIEVISDKTQDNEHRRNTFREMAATLTLRHATNAVVEGNFFLGNNVPSSGGIRVVGPGHRIYNNYFENIAGRTNGIIALEAGQPNAPASGYEPVTDLIVAHNTFVNSGDPAVNFNNGFDSDDRSVLPSGVTFQGNLISLPGQNVATGTDNGSIWSDTLAFVNGLGTAPAADTALLPISPLAAAADGLLRPTAGGPAENATAPAFAFITEDIDGQPRDAAPDIGADEISAAPIASAPLEAADVGPSWWNNGDPIDPGNSDADPNLSAVIEAEDAEAITDPDGDGDVFTVISDGAASGGEALLSPDGPRTNIDPGPQGTVASYTVTFPAAGTFTAYYRARGISGSSDSFFTPASFGTDPTVLETTSNDGSYRWEEGGTFTVSPGALERNFRIGRRERDTRIDVIVFYPEGGLSEGDLDFLAASGGPSDCPADLDGDGTLSFFDTLAFLKLFDDQDPDADLNPDGDFDEFDITLHLLAVQGGCP